MPSDSASTFEAEKKPLPVVEDDLAAPDLSDTYFFDHPLDHLPGTFLVHQTLAIASQRTQNDYSNFSACQFEWHEFAELMHPISCRAQLGDHVFSGSLYQSRKLATFSIGWSLELPQPLSGGKPPAQLVKPSSDVVHKRYGENILIGNCQWNSDGKFQCCVLPPHAGHLLDWESEFVHPLLLLESCKQLLTVAGQSMLAGFSQTGPAANIQLILKAFSLELACPILTSATIELAVMNYELRKWRKNVPKAASFEIAIRVGTETAGKLKLDSRIVEPEFFDYLRSQS